MTARVYQLEDERLILALRPLTSTRLEAELLATRVMQHGDRMNRFSYLVALGHSPEAAHEALKRAGMVAQRDASEACSNAACRRRIAPKQRRWMEPKTGRSYCSARCALTHKEVGRG